MAELFGFSIKRTQKALGTNEKSFVSPAPDDGSIEVVGGGFFGQVLDIDGREKTDIDLIRRYRDISQQSECDTAIEDIVNEGIVANQEDIPVQISLDRVPFSDKIKRKIRDEFEEVLRLFDFNVKGHDIFRRWYVDGRLYYQKIIDTKNPRKGISELRYIESTKIKKVRENKKEIDPKSGIEMITKIQDYFIYNDKCIQLAGITGTGANQGVKIAADAITYVPSGILEMNTGRVLSYLHKAIKPVNQLRMIEDALVIYRISRAPERRIFYIDVGNLPKIKAEQYLKDVMNRYRNKLVYDASTGEIRDDRNHMSMLEDFWLPRREGGRGTEITTLPGGQNLGEMEDVDYFRRKLYQSLNVPLSRLEADTPFVLGRASEISRDELKFSRFIDRIRIRFSHLFYQCLEKQLILKNVIHTSEWNKLRETIKFNYALDNHFAELKSQELQTDRYNMMRDVEELVGTYISKQYVKDNILRHTPDEQQKIEKEIEKEAKEAEQDAAEVPPQIPADPTAAPANQINVQPGQQMPPPEQPAQPEAVKPEMLTGGKLYSLPRRKSVGK